MTVTLKNFILLMFFCNLIDGYYASFKAGINGEEDKDDDGNED